MVMSVSKLTEWLVIPLLLIFVGVMVASCSTKEFNQAWTQTEKEYKEARQTALVMKGKYDHARKTYVNIKDDYQELRNKAIELHKEGKIPDKVWKEATELDQKLKELDARLVELNQKQKKLWNELEKVDTNARKVAKYKEDVQVTYEKLLNVSKRVAELGIVVAKSTA